jgi:hypothetical protein
LNFTFFFIQCLHCMHLFLHLAWPEFHAVWDQLTSDARHVISCVSRTQQATIVHCHRCHCHRCLNVSWHAA